MNSLFNKINPLLGRILFGLFIAFLWLPTLDMLFKTDHTQMTYENRSLATLPQWQGCGGDIQNYLQGLEKYFNDHFGYRKRLIRWNNRWRNNWFHQALHPNVTQGRDGWLYFVGDRVIENFHLGEPFTPEELQAWQTLFEARQAWLKKRGIKYQLVMVPIKSTLYPEYLPDWLTKSPKPAKLDQFLAYMQAHSTVPVLDLRPALLAAKANAFICLNTDSHWNNLGGFVGYQEIVKAVGVQIPGLQPLPRSAFDFKEQPERPGMDLAVMLGLVNQFLEKHFYDFHPLPPLMPLQHHAFEYPPNLSLKTTAPAIMTEWPAAQGRAVIFHDSYARNLFDFLGYHFNKTYWFWSPHFEPSLIDNLKPDIVIEERAEYTLFTGDPRALLHEENLQ